MTIDNFDFHFSPVLCYSLIFSYQYCYKPICKNTSNNFKYDFLYVLTNLVKKNYKQMLLTFNTLFTYM